MEFLNLPLVVVVASWIVNRLNKPRFVQCNAVKHLTSQADYITKILRITDPLRQIGWFESKVRNFLRNYRNILEDQTRKLNELNVVQTGYIKKGD